MRRFHPSPSPIPRGHPDLLPFDLHQRIRHASIFYASSRVPRPITALNPIAALLRSSSRRNKFMQCLLTAYIDQLRPRPPPHQAAPFCLSSNAARPTHSAQVILVLAKRKTAAKQRLCAPSRSHRRANAHPYTAIRRVASTTRARPRSSPPEARNQGSVSHPPRVNARLRTYRAKPAACYQTVMQQYLPLRRDPHVLHTASFNVAHIQLNKSPFLPSPRASTLNQRRKINSKENQSDVMSTMSSLGAASDSRLTQTQFNPSSNLESVPSRRSSALLLS
ncbi:hypothetical protein B0H16DRAFT_1621118 [Mycena metata]|uniref:Uncharacterized protein n=1 Tax=Mycena metata TaxID=1033252 RepID=A0AAD7MET0_9AGAR|nr:hypothetical protein B0H16DRAFT_1621118 [Mycena metata]